MFKDASPREKQKSKNWMLPDVPGGTEELPFYCHLQWREKAGKASASLEVKIKLFL